MTDSHTPDVEWAAMVDHLDHAADVSLPMDQAIVRWLAPPTGARTADVGCGAGAMTVLLAEAVGPGGWVLAVDGEQGLLAATGSRCDRAGVGDRVTTSRHNLAEGPPPAVDLDLVWAAHVVHHLPDQQAAIEALTASLARGGRLALAEGGLPRRCLPWDLGVGSPGLEDRLLAAEADWFAAMRRDMAGARRTPYGWSAALGAVGLVEVTARGFLLDRPAPLDDLLRGHVVDSLAVRVEQTTDRLSAEDRAAWDRLLDPDGKDGLRDRDDLHCQSVTTVHVGTRP